MAPLPDAERARLGFTLIELILIMALLAIAASLAAPQMASFFRGRSLEQESRRLLSLTHYAQSRAVTEGYPMMLWIEPNIGRYGLEIQPGFVDNDDRAVAYDLDASLTLEAVASTAFTPYEDEGVKRETAQTGILFLPDGLVDSSSLSRVILRHSDQTTVALEQMKNGLAFELTREGGASSR
ncbi:MAG TPA: prepilin-type N-terminal cleavage/methylation domain-containing protein [Opitutaceae bacterium]|nr:prepilin-type N-terminal cleavage/methylation domain-containing protein [Opitutaceae bacterium]